MRIYNYLYYKSFILAKKSKNFEDIPVLGGLMFLGICLVMNIGTIIGFIEGLGLEIGIDNFVVKYKYVSGFTIVALLLFYYSYKGRYKKIVAHYESKKDKGINIHPVIVIIIYYLGSFGLLLLVGLFKNRDWIFRDI
jgi:hypothetical protein